MEKQQIGGERKKKMKRNGTITGNYERCTSISSRKQNTDSVLKLLKNGKEAEALKILLNERGLTTVGDDDKN